MNLIWRKVALISYFGLFWLLFFWFAWLEPPIRIPVALVLILLVGPLLFPLRGLLYGRPYTHAWTSFLALFYFAVGIFHAAGPMARPWLAWLDIGFSGLLFLGAVLYVRTGAQRYAPTIPSDADTPTAHWRRGEG
ncbi:MAG: DUF2069 domain-containing protein [Candidatus Contendobacter sp.]|nr:DUF2069 domain-containing protein [Candidatus Contendobacter sp.]